jgi:hypothetical protein
MKKVKDYFNSHIVGYFEHKNWKATELDDVSGEAHINVIRGKQKIGYELSYSIKFV